MTRTLLVSLFIFALWPIASAAETGTEPSVAAAAAREVVESLHDVLIGCMREAEALGFGGRVERIGAKLSESFDLPFVARTGIGTTWKELSDEQRLAFIDLNGRLSAARYAANFDDYAGQRFETHEVEPAARGTVIVRTEFVQPKDRNVKFDYRLRKNSQGWRIIDVVIEGRISEFVIWRGQYRSVLESEGYAKLLVAMESKIEELSKE